MFFMMQFRLKTDRLTLIPVKPDDFDLLHNAFTEPFIRKYLWDDEIISHEQTLEILRTSNASFNTHGWGLWKIIICESDVFAGFAGLWIFFDEQQPQLLFGLMPAFTGFGFATEASRAIVDYAFSTLNFSHLVASFDAPNNASKKVCERLGMKKSNEKVINNKMTTFYRVEKT
jgi:ribosomal-protein-alanine N-acetyltransferase